MVDYTPMEPASEEDLWHAYRTDYLLMLMLRDSPEKMRVYECGHGVRLHVESDDPDSCKWGACRAWAIFPLYMRTLESHAAYIMEQDAPTYLKMTAVARLHREIKNPNWQRLAREIPAALYLLKKGDKSPPWPPRRETGFDAHKVLL